MNIIVDTCIWSLAFRRTSISPLPEVIALTELIQDGRVQMLGPIRQEILSGIKSKAQFLSLRSMLQAFPDLRLLAEDYETAAEYFNLCRMKGIQGSNTDFLICTVALRCNMPIFTNDKDFNSYQKVLKLNLYKYNK
ncbi:MAG: PIN domain-containing protein [Deltaproteobacteria bacterium]|nr:PIN domain-containing protein [Deltaproteobacteria bacterium]